MSSHVLLALSALSALFLAATAPAADELPPSRPSSPYEGVFEVAFKGEIAPQEETEFEDTLTVVVSGQRMQQESKAGDPKRTLMDLAKGEILEFDPEDPDRTVARVDIADVPPVLFVSGSSVFEEFGAPQAVGNEQVAGHACTLLRFGDPEQEGALACVTSDGIIVRARVRVSRFERSWQATKLAVGPVSDERLGLPDGFVAPGGRGQE